MSVIYNKSISDKFGKYFTSIDEMVKPFSLYSLETGTLAKKQTAVFNEWDLGKAGIPLAWNPAKRTVSLDHTDSHTLVVGPTGSKKSRLVVMPAVRILGSTGESMIISDPKAEIYNRTAAYLAEKGYNIYVLNLRSPMNGNQWNPLSIPYDFYMAGEIDKSYEFVNDIAENLIQTEKSVKDPFWDNSAGTFFFGLVLLLFKYCREHNLGKEYVHMGNVVYLRNELLSASRRSTYNELWKYAKTDSIIASSLIGTVETANDTKAGILSTFDQKVRMFSIQPNLLDMLGMNDFDFSVISREPTAVFLIVPDEKTGYHGLVSLFIKQSYEYMIFSAQQDAERDGIHTAKLKNRVNYILDEFSSMPTIRDFPAMVTAARSRNIRFTLVIQSKHQLIGRYQDEAETIQTNCNNWIFLTSRELQMLEEISKLSGTTLDNNQQVLSFSDLQRLDKETGEALLLCGRLKPCITKLPDIEEYDGNQFAILPVHTREQQILPAIDLSEEFKAVPEFPWMISDSSKEIPKVMAEKKNKSESKEEEKEQQPKNQIDMYFDEFIKKLDKKIEELEKEEKKNNQNKEEENK